ncbi:hypothetical protein D3C87_1532090 [compost metagenome]
MIRSSIVALRLKALVRFVFGIRTNIPRFFRYRPLNHSGYRVMKLVITGFIQLQPSLFNDTAYFLLDGREGPCAQARCLNTASHIAVCIPSVSGRCRFNLPDSEHEGASQ